MDPTRSPVAGESVSRSLTFRQQREKSWKDLENLIAQIERRGIRSLSVESLARVSHLYRAATSSLSVARSISLDQNLLLYLENLVARAWFCVYGPKRRLRDAVFSFLTSRFPGAVREAWRPLALATAFLIGGGIAGFSLTLKDPAYYEGFVSPAMSQGRDFVAPVEELRELLFHEGGSDDVLVFFSSFLFTHNAGIGLTAFGLGFLFGLPVFLLMFLTGAMIGAMSALHHARGLAIEWWSWILPHGITEIFAILLCGAGGLMLARGLVFPGRESRLQSLACAGRKAGVIVFGAVLLLLIAGIIEGVFRQRVQAVPVRYAVAALTAVGLAMYILLAPGGGPER